ncbi:MULTISPECIES: signal peptidase I [Enterocloster]|uniref:Signal peptidase I n=1 Tax=Enterocloster lavalensis TaxID=460384 RepID=A0A1I0D8B0_9FIRM|nr:MULTISPECIES: signal peptidase I [Enterocloster]MDR3759670.1 signal peptidase I [Enterocloster sp.]PST35303.1 signal peptidase I [Enterocloster lavalensis]SET28464.1 Signal peptidase I Serine peptidase. MEROPS family S26B [Enterocloster lavalensis]
MKEKNGLLQKIVGAVGIALCVVFVPLLLINVTLIVKSYTSPDKVPDFFGYKPFIVLSGSMEPSIMTGDMVFVKETDPDSLKVGDVIAYKSGSAVVTHRIVEVKSENGETRYVTQGDANNAADQGMVKPADVEGIYQRRIAGAGNLAMFMQTTTGMILFVVCPLVLFVLWDVIRRQLESRKEMSRTKELEMELERLRAEKG